MVGVAILVGSPLPAHAQESRLRLSPVEVSLGVTINAVTTDVNIPPHCLRLALPCSHAEADRFGGFGIVAGFARNLTERLAIAGEIGTFRAGWDASDPGGGVRRVTTAVTSFFAGPKVTTGFYSAGDRSIGRFFGQLLVGGEASGVVPLRPALLAGGGADFTIPAAARGAPGSRPPIFRWSLDYRVSPGADRSFSGYRLAFQVLFGPTLK